MVGGTGFFLPRTCEDARDKRKRSLGSKGPSCRSGSRAQAARQEGQLQGPLSSPPTLARYSLIDAAPMDGACLLQQTLCSPPSSICGDLDPFNSLTTSNSGASFTGCLSGPYLALSAGDNFPTTPSYSSGCLGAVTHSSQPGAAPAWAVSTPSAPAVLAAIPQQQQYQQQGVVFVSPQQQQQQQLLVSPPQLCYKPTPSVASTVAAVSAHGLQDMLLLQQQQAELDATISNLLALRQQLTNMRPPAAAPAPAPGSVFTSPIAPAVAPVSAQQYALVPVQTVPAAVLSPNQAMVGAGQYAAQQGWQQCQAAAVAPDGGCVSLALLQQQAADLNLEAEIARMLSLL